MAMMVSAGRGLGRDRIISRKCLVFWTWEGKDLTKGWRGHRRRQRHVQ